jgi:hypothetical protein
VDSDVVDGAAVYIDEDCQDSAEGAGGPGLASNPGLCRYITSLVFAKVSSLSSFFLTSDLPVFMLDLHDLNVPLFSSFLSFLSSFLSFLSGLSSGQ